MVTIIINIMIILIIPKIKVEVVVGVVLSATSEAITPRAMHSCCELWHPDTPLRITLLVCLVAELKARADNMAANTDLIKRTSDFGWI